MKHESLACRIMCMQSIVGSVCSQAISTLYLGYDTTHTIRIKIFRFDKVNKIPQIKLLFKISKDLWSESGLGLKAHFTTMSKDKKNYASLSRQK